MSEEEATMPEFQHVGATSDRTLGLEQMPLELRTEIYNEAVENVTELMIPNSFNGSARLYLSQRLPLGLAPNHRIYSEAITAYFRRSMLSVEKIIAPDPDMLLADTPSTLLFKSLRQLEFTREQGHLTSRPGFADPTTVYDVTSRSPELQVLKVPVTEQMFYTTDASSGKRRHKTMEEVNAGMKFTKILERGEKLRTIQLTCASMARSVHYRGTHPTTQFDELAAWFWNECVKRGREIDFVIEVGPQDSHSRKNPEIVWYTQGHVKRAWYFDFFG